MLSHVRILAGLMVAFVVLGGLTRAAHHPADLPAPRSAAWVIDQAGALPTSDVSALNALGDAVHQRNGAELAIVVIDSTGGADPRNFATGLFNHWRLGQRDRDNGILLFVALQDRAAEIILGARLDGDDQVATSNRIMQETIVPHFRAGNAAAAITAGARACADQFFGVSSSPAPAGGAPASLELERPASTAPPGLRPPTSGRSPAPARSRLSIWVAAIFGAGFLAVGGGIVAAAIARARPRRCRHCSIQMQKLDEAADDAHLAGPERAEERVGSVNYDVWLCPSCNAVEKVRHGRWFTSYACCPSCGAKTKSTRQQTVQAATTMSSGLVQVDETCANCSYARSYTRAIPRVSSSSGSSHRSSSGSRSSSGGGRSSGRGASGRW